MLKTSAYLCRPLLVLSGSEDDLQEPEGWQEDLSVEVQRAGDEPGGVPLAKHPAVTGREDKMAAQ